MAALPLQRTTLLAPSRYDDTRNASPRCILYSNWQYCVLFSANGPAVIRPHIPRHPPQKQKKRCRERALPRRATSGWRRPTS